MPTNDIEIFNVQKYINLCIEIEFKLFFLIFYCKKENRKYDYCFRKDFKCQIMYLLS